MSNEVSRELDVLAPRYLEILDRLSDSEELKYLFYLMGSPFADAKDQLDFMLMVDDHDPQVRAWRAEDLRRRLDLEEQQREEAHFAARSSLRLDELVEKQTINGKPALQLKPDASTKLINSFNTGSWWYPSLITARDDNDNLVDFAIIGRNNGASRWLIGVDEETGQLAFGDKLHCFSYDHIGGVFTGEMGGLENIPLNEMGRRANSQAAPSSKRLEAVHRILGINS